MNKLRGVEAGRGIAAILVVFVHASDMLSPGKYFGALPFAGAFKFAHAGVDFFFVLSGFIIYYVHKNDIGQPSRVRNYAWRRFARIYPTYWVIMAGFGLLLLYSPYRNPDMESLGNIIASILLLPRLQAPLLGVAWTLRHELLFYSLFAILILNRAIGTVALSIWAGLIMWNVVIICFTGSPYFQGIFADLPFRLFNLEFFFGMGIAIIIIHEKFYYARSSIALGALLFFGTGMIESFGPHLPNEWPILHLGYALGAALALYGLVGAERQRHLQVPEPIYALGTASYSIYLTHVIAIMILVQAIPFLRRFLPLDIDVVFLIISSIAIAAGVLFSRIVEQPLLRRFRNVPTWLGGSLQISRNSS